MENSQIETTTTTTKSPVKEIPFARKSHLKSETYRTLVRILSICHDKPQLCETPQILSYKLRPDNGMDELLRQVCEKEACEVGELVSTGSTDQGNSMAQKCVVCNENFEAICCQGEGFGDTHVVIDEIENIMRIEEEEDEGVSKQKDPVVGEGTGLQDREFVVAQQLLINELEHAMKGNEVPVRGDNCSLVTTSFNENLNGAGGGSVNAFSNNQEEHLDPQPMIMEESGGVGQQQAAEKEHCSLNISESFGSFLDRTTTIEVSKPGDNSENNGSFLGNTDSRLSHEMQQKEMELEKSVCIKGTMASSYHMTVDGLLEEGEISGPFEVDDRLVDMFSDDAAILEEKNVDEKLVSDDFIDKNKLPQKNEANEKNSEAISFVEDTVDNASNGKEVEAKNINRNEMVCKRKVVVYEDPILAEEGGLNKEQKKGRGTKKQQKGQGANERKKGSGTQEQKKGTVANDGVGLPMACPNQQAEKLSLDATGNQEVTSKEKKDTGLCNKRKRGPPSEENKANKKQKKRKKRSERNQKLGVKRLKLRPVVKPKPVTDCRHYLMGRCREGEKCKYSHDAIPLTKSKPCFHFARQSCMKGDDCPFDHQLSKYPCTNYVSTGSCSRGENCMFSHKLTVKEDFPSTSNVSTPNPKIPSLVATLNSKKQVDIGGTTHQPAKTLSDSVEVVSHKNTDQGVAKSILNPPTRVPKGISLLSAGKSLMIESSLPKLSSASLKMNEGAKGGNQTNLSASGTVQNLNEITKGPPASVVPKGINFLSFGKAPSEYSSAKKLTSRPINQNDGAKFSVSNEFRMQKLGSSSPNINNSVLVGRDASQSVPNTALRLNEMLQKTEPAVAPLKSNPFSFGEASTDGSRNNRQTSLPFSLGNGVDGSVQASKNASDKHQNLSVIPQGLPASPLGSGQSSCQLAHACLKKTPNSAQKALMSTLAFAAKVESGMRMNRSTVGALGVSGGVNKESGLGSTSRGSHNDSAKASKILDFITGIGGKTSD